MGNKFGVKDFFIFVLLAVIGITVWLSMTQKDRDRELLMRVSSKIDELGQQSRQGLADSNERTSKQIAELRAEVDGIADRLASGVVAVAPGGSGTGAEPRAARGGRDESWARAGTPIKWQPAWTFSTDPREQEGFREGGTFTEVYEVQLPSIVPFIQTDVYGRRIIDMVCEPLAVYDAKSLELRGVLAEAWQMDPKGMWLRAKIRDEARFSDGKPVTAEDLRWTFHDVIMNPQIDASRERSTLSTSIKSVTVISERVVEFEFIEPIFLNESNALTIFVLPKHFYEQFTPAEINKSTGLLMGSGPFRLEVLDKDNQWSPPNPVVLVRNEGYWGTKPSLERIRLLSITEELARVTTFRNNQADMITPTAPQFRSLMADPEFTKENRGVEWTNMRSGNSFIAWQCGPRAGGELTPFADARVRKAMTHLLDREKMIRDIWAGLGRVSKGNFNPSSPASNPDIKPWPFDLAKAKALLKEAGWEDRNGDGVIENEAGKPFEFEFTYFAGGEIAERVANFVKDSSAAAGIVCRLNGIDWSVGEDRRKRRDFDAMTLAWGANAPESDPRQIFHSDSIKDQGDNFGQWNNPEADRLIEAGRRELDFAKRMKLWHQFEAVMHDDQPYTWVRIQAYPRLFKPDIGNVNTYPKGLETWEFFRAGGPLPASAN